MKTVLKQEELLKLILSFLASLHLGFEWWVFFLWLLAPDIGILGYAVNKKFGSITYNLFHHQGIAIIAGIIGYCISNTELIFAGLILFGHSSMDRIFGYGLKYPDDFKNTHLGRIGTKNG